METGEQKLAGLDEYLQTSIEGGLMLNLVKKDKTNIGNIFIELKDKKVIMLQRVIDVQDVCKKINEMIKNK